MANTNTKEQQSPKITAREINLPKGGGAIKGMGDSFQPNFFTGTGSYTIPLPVPAARGMEPSLSLNYNSGAGNGSFGMGFSLSLSKISINTSKRIPRYDGTDTYLSSEVGELVKKILQDVEPPTVDQPYTITRYLPRIENQFSSIEYWYDQASGDSYWKIISKDNISSYYGCSPNSRISNPSDPAQVFEWLIDETRDAKGNKIAYKYKEENKENIPASINEVNRLYEANRYIRQIQYGNYVNPKTTGSFVPKKANKPVSQKKDLFAFEIVFDYGEYDLSNPATAYTPSKPWLYRPDSFSLYNSGFEIRTCRLCRNVLLFHHFINESAEHLLSKSVELTYKNQQPLPAGSFEGPALLSTAQVKGYRKNDDNSFSDKTMPPLALRYSAFKPPASPVFGRLQMGSGTIPGRLDGSQFIPVDLYGEGLPGFLYSNNETTFYLEPEGDGKYSTPEYLDEFPINKNLQGGTVSITDIDGNGQLELLVSDPGKAGYYQYKNDGSWDNFRSFSNYPIDIANPKIEYADLDANGKTDLLLPDKDNMLVYFSDGKNGYQPGKKVLNENGFPLVKENYEEELVTFANIFGDGLSHRVKISNGSVECWPCLGYGNYGKKIKLANAPVFKDYFDRSRLFFADLDGSGTADMIYVYPTHAAIFLNQSGNSFSDAIRVNLPGICTELDQVSFADVLGNGTSCLIFSKMTPVPVHYYYNFVGDIKLQDGKEKTALKPYLLNEIDNHMGAITQISYCSSTRFYLEDKKAGRNWFTKLPFPVQVVEHTTMIDKISGSVFVNKFKYHDGYYDPDEREFCGFGFVESWDTQTYEEYQTSVKNPDFPVQRLNKELYVPPVYTRTWHNTGSFKSNPIFTNPYKKDYFNKDLRAYDFPASILQTSISFEGADTLRQACFALKGQVMRTEVYANDESKWAAIPYTVTESNVGVVLMQPKQGNKYAVFMVIPHESISYNYERNENDPLIKQEFVLETDLLCGLASRTCTVYLPRRSSPAGIVNPYPEQERLKALISTNLYINTDKPATGHWRGVSCEEKAFQLFNPDIKGKEYFSYEELKTQTELAFTHTIIPYNQDPVPGQLAVRQYSWSRQYFWNAVRISCSDYLPLQNISPQGLLHHEENAVCTTDWISKAFGNKITPTILTKDAGYIFEAGTGYWWNKGLVQHYLGEDGFYLPYTTANCFAGASSSLLNKTVVEFDSPYYLLPVKLIRVLGAKNIESSYSIDYQCLAYKQTIDSNKIVGQILFDPLGQVIATSLFGAEDGVETGGMRIYAYDGKPAEYQLRPASFEDILNNPARYLQGVVTYFYYNPDAWQEGQPAGKEQPSSSITLAAQNYYRSAVTKPAPFSYQLLINYSDGLGRSIGQKQWAGAINISSRKIKPDTKTIRSILQDKWLNSGRIVYNNKGKACEEYLPFFDSSPWYESQKELEDNKDIPPPTVTHYDPLERIIRMDTPKGFFSKTEYTPWEVKKFDEDDTVTHSDYYKKFVEKYPKNPPARTQAEVDEMDALDKAKMFTDTPSIEVMDNMGFTICTIQTMPGRQIPIYRINDIQGRQLELTDARLYQENLTNNKQYFNFRYRYMMNDKDPFYTNSADAGIQMALNNMYGNQICSYDAMNYCQFISYDALQRKTELRVKQLKPSGPVISFKDYDLVEQIIYGESQTDAVKYNLNGQIYQINDLSGLAINKSYSLQGQVLEGSRQLPDEYQKEITWNGPSLPLLSKPYPFKYSYDALKLVLSSTTPDGSVIRYTYNQLGLAITNTVVYKDGTVQPVITEIGYSPGLQRAYISYGNGITTQYTYEKTTQNLLSLISQRRGSNVKTASADTTVQNISYIYDPVGNITRMWDLSYQPMFNNNQQVDPRTDYTYDAIYRLIKANGRQHPGINGSTYTNNKPGSFKQSIFTQLPCINDNCKLENYKEAYTYDDSGNLIKKQHTASSYSFTTETIIENNSDQLKEIRISGLPDTAVSYDASGNQTSLYINNSVPLSFNCYEKLIKAAIIKRPDEPGDTEYYLYDSTGARTRKVTERLAENGSIIEVTEKIYLGNYEIKRNKRTGNAGNPAIKLERETLRVMDDETCIALIHYWQQDVLQREVDEPGQRSVRFQMGNNIGSVSMEMDKTAKLISYEEYFPYGGTAIIAGENEAEVALKDYRYSGKECDDSTGLYYYGARYYISWLGRWLSPDPAGPVDGLNLYAFVKCNPIKFIDQTGNISVGGARVLLNIVSLFLFAVGPVWGGIIGAREGASRGTSSAGRIAGGIVGGIAGALTGFGLGLINTILTPVRWVVESSIALARWLGPEVNAAHGTYPAVLYNATQTTNFGIDFNTARLGAESIAEEREIPRSLWGTLLRPYDNANLADITNSARFDGTLVMVGHGAFNQLETVGNLGESGAAVEARLRNGGLNWTAIQRIDMSICDGNVFAANLRNAIVNPANGNVVNAAGITTRAPAISVTPLGNLLGMGRIREFGRPIADFFHWMTGGIFTARPIETAAAPGGPGSNVLSVNAAWNTIRT